MIIKQETAEIDTPSGRMRTYIYRPVASGKYPGLTLFSEIFQRTSPIERTAMYYAGHGFIVAVPEIFHELEKPGEVLAYDQGGADRGNFDKVNKTLESYDSDARAVIAFLSSHPQCTGKLGSIGICIGGHLSFRCAMNREVLAAVCFYATDIHKRGLGLGMNDDSLERIKDIRGELMMVWGRQDPHIPTEGRQLIYQRLTEAGAHFTWHEFNGAHAFLRDEGPRYDPELAGMCYRMSIDLFRRKLGDGDMMVERAPTGSGETKH